MKLKIILIFAFFYVSASAQQLDSVRTLNEIIISSYLGDRPARNLPSSVNIIDSTQLKNYSGQSFVSVLNSTPGVKMEERSPGSYRLSIRGSLLRSPFGIRNIKMYLDEFPLTDGGGNTYLNLIDVDAINKIEILKGPDGSLFGANSGGVLRLGIFSKDTSSRYVYGGINGGSYNFLKGYAGSAVDTKINNLSFHSSWQHSDGYRENSALTRNYIQLCDVWKYNSKASLKFLLMNADLEYQTPGGLNLTQFTADPSQARPPTATAPGAVLQKAAIYNKTIFGGIIHEIKISENVKHVISVYGSGTRFKNPFITNYEERNESNAGVRTWLQTVIAPASLNCTWHLGAEAQMLGSKIENYKNNQGDKGELIASGIFSSRQGFVFTHFSLKPVQRITLEASTSLNFNNITYSQNIPALTGEQLQTLKPQLMPRVAASYAASRAISVRWIVSRGYSPPTLAEFYPSSNIFNKLLQPESGWNYETGMKYRKADGRISWDVSVFYYKLQKAITRRVNENDQEYFVNAGGTDQPGIESQIIFHLLPENYSGTVRQIILSQSYAYSPFTFSDYKNSEADYSGNRISGIPEHVATTSLKLQMTRKWKFFVQHSYVSRLPLNDANTDYAYAYNLLMAKISHTIQCKKLAVNLSAGIDNILNEKYSSGNDLNAFGGRYYNAAAPRNYFVGVNFLLK